MLGVVGGVGGWGGREKYGVPRKKRVGRERRVMLHTNNARESGCEGRGEGGQERGRGRYQDLKMKQLSSFTWHKIEN